MAKLEFGKVSSVNYDEGTVSVYFSHTSDNNTTDKLPLLSLGTIFNVPDVDDIVAVITDDDNKLVLGKIWGGQGDEVPEKFNKDVFGFYFDDDAHISYDKVNRKLSIKAKKVELIQDE